MDVSQPKLFLIAAISFAGAAIAFAVGGNLLLGIAVAIVAVSLMVVSTQAPAPSSERDKKPVS